jgi:hypothetical protein
MEITYVTALMFGASPSIRFATGRRRIHCLHDNVACEILRAAAGPSVVAGVNTQSVQPADRYRSPHVALLTVTMTALTTGLHLRSLARTATAAILAATRVNRLAAAPGHRTGFLDEHIFFLPFALSFLLSGVQNVLRISYFPADSPRIRDST